MKLVIYKLPFKVNKFRERERKRARERERERDPSHACVCVSTFRIMKLGAIPPPI